MSESIKERVRKVNLDNMTNEDIDNTGFNLGVKVGAITSQAAEEINKLVKIYGLHAKIAVELTVESTGETHMVDFNNEDE